MTPGFAQELLDVVFTVYTEDEAGLGDNESPIIGVRSDLRAALRLAFERLLQGRPDGQDFTLAVLGPYDDGRVTWLLETPDWSMIIEALRLSGERLSEDLTAWLLDPARLESTEA